MKVENLFLNINILIEWEIHKLKFKLYKENKKLLWTLTLAFFLLKRTLSLTSLPFLWRFVLIIWACETSSVSPSDALEESPCLTSDSFLFFPCLSMLYSRSVMWRRFSSADLANSRWNDDGCSRNNAFLRAKIRGTPGIYPVQEKGKQRSENTGEKPVSIYIINCSPKCWRYFRFI